MHERVVCTCRRAIEYSNRLRRAIQKVDWFQGASRIVSLLLCYRMCCVIDWNITLEFVFNKMNSSSTIMCCVEF